MCLRSCTGVFSEVAYGLKYRLFKFKRNVLLYKATTLNGARKRFEFSLSFGQQRHLNVNPGQQ